MEDFTIYQRFSSLDEAKILTDLLDFNQIPYKVGGATMRFEIAETSFELLENEISMKIEEDIGNGEKLNQQNADSCLDNDHYLHLMPDNFVLEAIVNPLEWTKEEHLLAKKILRQRYINNGKINKIFKKK